VGQGDFPRPGSCAAAHQTRPRYRMMGRPEWPADHEGGFRQHACRAVDPGHLHGLVTVHGGLEPAENPRQAGFACPRRPHHQEMMPPDSG